MNLCKLQPMV